MFDVTPLTTTTLLLTILAFVGSYFGIAAVAKKKWLRSVIALPTQTGESSPIYYAGALLIATTVLFAAIPLWESPRLLASLVAAAFVILLGGVWDEHSRLQPLIQLLLQALAASIAVFGGWTIQHISQPTGAGVIVFEPWIGGLLAIAWLLLLMNTVNWLDGIDGQSASVGTIALLTLALVTVLPSVQDSQTLALALIGAGSIAGFLVWNFPPARIYLGTTGSWWLGLYIGLVAINGGGKIVTTLLVLALPVVDVLVVSLVRLRAGQRPWQGDTVRHLHHRLLQRGWSHRRITLATAAITAVLGLGAILLQTQQKIIALVIASTAILIAGSALAMNPTKARWKNPKIVGASIAGGLLLILLIAALAQKPCRNFNEGQVITGPTTWSVALADIPEEHKKGLMECEELPEKSGMYFTFKQPTTNPFWMKDMLIPIDIVWIRDGQIIGIENQVPAAGNIPNPPQYYAPQPYTAVLELPSGAAQQHGLAVGQEVALDAH